MDEILNSENAEQENVVDSPQEETEQDTAETVSADKTDDAENEEVTPSQQKEKPVQTPEENAKIAAARRAAAQRAKDEVIAEVYGETNGIKTYADYRAALAKQQEQEQITEMLQSNIPEAVAKELLESRKFREEAQKKEYDAQIEKQKAVLRDQPYFIALEPEIDALISDSKSRGQQINVAVAYNYLRGAKMDELMKKADEKKEKSTVANIQDRMKRPGSITADSTTGDSADISNIDLDMAAAFGNDPKEIAKYVNKSMRR
jgi:hypothetical protein